MKCFIKRGFIFVLAIPVIFIPTFLGVDYYLNHHGIEKENSIFIWGDSQAYRGIDLNLLKIGSKKEIYTAARHGAGPYDFLVFTGYVPSNSTVIVALSKPVQLRRKEMDGNSLSLSVPALMTLKKSGYSFMEVLKIIRKNRKPKTVFRETTELFKWKDSIAFGEPLSYFQQIYRIEPYYLDNKQKVLLEGIKILKNKNCNILFLEFPYHPILRDIEKASPVYKETEDFKQEALSIFEQVQIESIKLPRNREIMHDLTHLNELGAGIVSRQILSILNRHKDGYLNSPKVTLLTLK